MVILPHRRKAFISGATKALSLNGTDQYLKTGDTADWDLGTGDFTFSCWVYFDSFPDIPSESDLFRIIGEGRGSSGTGSNHTGWTLRVNKTSNELTLNKFDGSGTNRNFAWTPSTSTWYLVVLVRAGDNLSAYINNSQIGSTQSVAGVSYNREEANGVYVGRYVYGSAPASSYIDGSVATPRVWKGRALDASDRSELYNSGKGLYYASMSAGLKSGLVLSLPCHSDDANPFDDDSGNSNNATAFGSPTTTGAELEFT